MDSELITNRIFASMLNELRVPVTLEDMFEQFVGRSMAAKSGVVASECAVIEDTPTGVTAGVAAGMTVYGCRALTPRQRLIEAGAHHTFDNMT